jgi:AcrR family transcriptional regulator
MILAAERLFAQRGPFAVSMREVGVAAGQKNNSAAQYHFGSKTGLVQAILEHRMYPINERRLAMLAAMAAEGRSEDLRSLMEAFFLPLMDAVGAPGKSTYYARFLSHVAFVPGMVLNEDRQLGYTSGWNIAWQGALRAVGHLPRPVALQRLQLVSRLMITVLADQEGLADRPHAPSSGHLTAPTDLIDVAVSMMLAPVSESTRRLVAAAGDDETGAPRPTPTTTPRTRSGPSPAPGVGAGPGRRKLTAVESDTAGGPNAPGRAVARPQSAALTRKAFP